MTYEMINRLAWRTDFSYDQIKAYVHRVYRTYGDSVPDAVLVYSILEAAAMNIDLDILGAPPQTVMDFIKAGYVLPGWEQEDCGP